MSEDVRLPAHLEVSSLVRQVNGAGGFATVIARGEREAGTILVVTTRNGRDSSLYERMPRLDGTRGWHKSKEQDSQDPGAFDSYLQRRREQDPDIWIVELDVEDGERFIVAR